MTLARKNYTHLVLCDYVMPSRGRFAQPPTPPADLPYARAMSVTPSRAARVLALAALLSLVTIGPASALDVGRFEKQVVAATNEYRAAQGKKAVKLQRCVDRWANGQAAWMARNKKLEHRAGRLGKVMRSCRLNGAAENIAWNYSSGSSTVRAWAASPGHAVNMRGGAYRYIGVGVARASNGEIYVSQVFGSPR